MTECPATPEAEMVIPSVHAFDAAFEGEDSCRMAATSAGSAMQGEKRKKETDEEDHKESDIKKARTDAPAAGSGQASSSTVQVKYSKTLTECSKKL